jgi:hypothetical protein
MTPKEKAEELILKYLRIDNDTQEWFHKGLAKQCALVAVEQIYINNTDESKNDYWIEVIREIENL